MPNDNIQFIFSNQLFLNTLLMEIKGKLYHTQIIYFLKTPEKKDMLKEEIFNLEQNLTQGCSQQLGNNHNELKEIRTIR